MKKINSIILTAVAALAFAPVAGAQTDYSINGQIKDPKYGTALEFPNDKGVDMPEGKNFGYSKNISSPFSDGTYWIKLESFATGNAVVEDKPSDIVLLLDVSGSMDTNYTSNVYEPVVSSRTASSTYGSPAGSYDYNNLTDITRYIRYNKAYYQVRRGRVNGNSGGFFLYFVANGTTYYLDHYQITTTMPTGYTNNQRQAWWGYALYELHSSATRMHALKEAVVAFIEEIQENDLYFKDENDNLVRRTDENGNPTNLGNRVSIVKFAGNKYNENNPLAEGNHRYYNNNYNNTELIKNFTYVEDGVDELIKSFAGVTQGGTTAVDWGMDIANAVLAQPEPTSDRVSNKTLVMLTDGSPTHSSNFQDAVANDAILRANTSKTTYKAKVFAVGILTSDAGNIGIYMNRVSSNYEKATSLTNTEATKVSSDFYFNANSGNLKNVFVNIAKQSGGSSSALSTAISNVDVVSNSFILPEGADASNIGNYVKVFTAPLDEIDSNGNYVFGTETLAGHATDTYDVLDAQGNVTGTYKVDEVPNPNGTTPATLPIKVELVGTNGIKVTNFDYSGNWCGPVKNQAHEITDYHGHKIIIMIPIKMNPDAVGGPNVQTNAPGSGIFINENESYVEFTSPTVSLPVNIYIEKAGMQGIESGKFMIERAIVPDLPEGQDELTVEDIEGIAESDWEYVSTVFVTNSTNAQHATSGNPVVKVKGLPATKLVDGKQKGLVYRIHEENWSWSYTNGDGYQYTVTGQVNNPFTFTNSKTANIDKTLKHAESKVTNIFKNVDTKEVYDDSKTNTRD